MKRNMIKICRATQGVEESFLVECLSEQCFIPFVTLMADIRRERNLYEFIFIEEDDSRLGIIILKKDPQKNRCLDVTISVIPKYRNQKVAEKAMQLLLEKIRTDGYYTCLETFIRQDNEWAQRHMQKFNFVKFCTRQSHSLYFLNLKRHTG